VIGLRSRTLEILVVDDDPEMRRYIQRSLQRALGEGGRIHLAGDGVEALAMAEAQRLDALITDVLLPRLDGLSLCQAIERSARTAELPVLIVSGELDAIERAQALARTRPHRAFLAKPFNGRSLLAALDRLLEGASPAGR